MAAAERWYFTKEQLGNSPSRKHGIDWDKELSYRQQAANFIQDMGQRLQVSQLCINTAIVYMHRFYVYHSFTKFHRNHISVCALFLAAKVEEQPRKLEHVIKVAHMCLHREEPPLDTRSEQYLEKTLELVINENMMLQTLGFDIAIDHPHTYVVKCCQLVRASKDLAQTSYFMATNSLHLTTMCLQYKPTVVACVCIHLACKWSSWEIPKSSEGKEWFWYVEKFVTLDLLEDLTKEFLAILDKCPSRLKRKIMSGGGKEMQQSDKNKNEPQNAEIMEKECGEMKLECLPNTFSPLPSTSFHEEEEEKISIAQPVPVLVEPVVSAATVQNSPSKKIKMEGSHSISLAVYREKKEKERLAEQRVSRSHQEVSSALQKSSGEDKTTHRISVNHEKVRHSKSHSKQGETVISRTGEKSNKRNIISNSQGDSTSFDKTNHRSPRLPPVENISHSKDNRHSRSNAKHSPEAKKLSNTPYVVLTRLEISQGRSLDTLPDAGKNITSVDDSTVMQTPLNIHLADEVKISTKHQNENSSLKHENNTCDTKGTQNIPEGAQVKKLNKLKPQKHKSGLTSPHSGHNESQLMSQGNQKQNPVWDGAKANGSKIPEPVSMDHKSHSASEVHRVLDKNSELPNKHERREKHRHKHSMHSVDREKSSNRSLEQTGNTNVSGGLKITIPKDKIILGNSRHDSSQRSSLSGETESPARETLKIKIPKVKISAGESAKSGASANSSGSCLKLVITKDRLNAGSYSTSQKADRESRKRERSPKDLDHDARTLESSLSSKPPKIGKQDQMSRKSHSQEGPNTEVPLPSEPSRLSRHTRCHGEGDQLHVSGGIKPSNSGVMYHQAKDASHSYVIYGGGAQYYQQYYPYQPVHMAVGGYQNQPIPPMFGHPPPPPPPLDAPPLPKDPPPPLPPPPPE